MTHDPWLEEADVYALGVLEGEELARFEAHLGTGCAACAARVTETREALTVLPQSLPRVAPPPALRARVLDRTATDRSPAPATVRLDRRRGPGRVIRWTGWAGLAAVAALLLVVNTELRTTRQQMRALQGRLTTLQTDLAQREQTLRLFSDPDARYVPLAGLKPTPEASAWLVWNPGTRQGVLLARGLPAAPAGHAYELWALAGATPVPAGVFSVDAGGRALMRLAPLPTDHAFDAFAVTLEPVPGVPKPTGPMHLLGKV